MCKAEYRTDFRALNRYVPGGAGPYYGLYSLKQVAAYTERIDSYTEEEMVQYPPLIDCDLTSEQWAALVGDGDCENDSSDSQEDQDEQWENIKKRIHSGILTIGTQGCTFDNLLMWKGSEKGKIVYIDWNLEPENAPFLTGLPFLQWYEAYFKEIIAGHNLTSFGYISLKSESQLISDYRDARTLEEKRTLLKGFYKWNQAAPETINFLAALEEPALDGMRVELLFRFDLQRGLRVFKELLEGKNPQGIVSCARRMPDEYKNDYYPAMLNLLKQPGIKDKCRILYFLKDCSWYRAKDLVSFAMDEQNSEEERKCAVYVMGSCPDKMEYLPVFEALMRGKSYWLAHTALQAVARTKCPKLLETYKWMWETYKNDSIMKSNLKIAFQTNGMTFAMEETI